MKQEKKNPAAVELGIRGGTTTKTKYGLDYYKKIGLRGSQKRWKIHNKVGVDK